MTNEDKTQIKSLFIKGLILYSKQQISLAEATRIANQHLICEAFEDGTFLAHKGPDWAAWDYCKSNGYWVYQPQ